MEGATELKEAVRRVEAFTDLTSTATGGGKVEGARWW